VQQCGKYSSLTGWVVVGPSIKIEVSMGRFTVHSKAQGTAGSSVSVYVNEREEAFSFGLHGELNALVDTVQVVQEVLQLVGSVWPNDECVIYIAKPAEGLVGRQVKRSLLEVLDVEVGQIIDLFV
jgi:hypothetical protein